MKLIQMLLVAAGAGPDDAAAEVEASASSAPFFRWRTSGMPAQISRGLARSESEEEHETHDSGIHGERRARLFTRVVELARARARACLGSLASSAVCSAL